MNVINKLRSSKFILVFKGAHKHETLVSQLVSNLQIPRRNNQTKWRYLVRRMYNNNNAYTYVYISLPYKPYINVKKVNIKINDYNLPIHAVHVWDSDHLLKSLLIFDSKFDFNNLTTNMLEADIAPHVCLLRNPTVRENQSTKPENIIEEGQSTKPKRVRKEMSDAQNVTFKEHYQQFLTVCRETLDAKALVELQRLRGNMVNFRSTYNITLEQQEQIRDVQLKCKEVKKSLRL